jgi:predicted Zn-dependent protease with MMP-like domain
MSNHWQTRMDRRPRINLAELVRRGQDALEREDFRDAEACARRALMMDPQSLEGRQVLASALIEQARYEEAVPCLEEILEREEHDVVSLADLGLCLFEMCLFEEAEAVLARALEVDATDPQACYWMALCVERRGYYELADEYFQQAHEADPEAYPLPARIPRAEFEEAAEAAILELPDELQAHLDQVPVVIEDLPGLEDLTEYDPPLDPCLYGLYEGVPLPERSESDPPRLPDRIHLYRRNLERLCPDRETLVQEIRITILHEIGHYLGLDEEELAERGLA